MRLHEFGIAPYSDTSTALCDSISGKHWVQAPYQCIHKYNVGFASASLWSPVQRSCITCVVLSTLPSLTVAFNILIFLCSPLHTSQYFASGLAQNGDTHEGIQGFLICDILTEVRRSHGRMARVCAFCRKKGAAVRCTTKGCRLVGHFPCLKQPGDFLFQHFDRFEAFCPHHAPKQRFLRASSLPSHTDLHTCCICLSQIQNVPSFSELYCPSCETFLHRDCLQVRQ